jgi:hypothetical protein
VKVEDSNLVDEIEEIYILESGTFYFCSQFVISEINEGINFDWKLAQEVIDLVYNHYGAEVEISYISNRVNSYSLVPQDWLKFFEARHTILSFCIVTYTKAGLMNIMLEKLFFKSKMKKFEKLYEATDWVKANAPVINRRVHP